MSFKDHFSGHANVYAKYRPDYPAARTDSGAKRSVDSAGLSTRSKFIRRFMIAG
jgi:hypothetical protein